MESICIVNYGDVSTINIANCLKRMKINNFHVIKPSDMCRKNTSHVILSGGPQHVYKTTWAFLPKWLFRGKYKILGICYGMQLLCYNFGSKICNLTPQKKLAYIYEYSGKSYKRWINRSDYILDVPCFFNTISVCEKGYVSQIETEDIIGVQFHPESPRKMDLSLFARFLGLDN